MSNWTPDQERAIHESGQNIIVSAGAGFVVAIAGQIMTKDDIVAAVKYIADTLPVAGSYL